MSSNAFTPSGLGGTVALSVTDTTGSVALANPEGMNQEIEVTNDGPETASRWLERYGDGGWPNADDDGSLALDLGVTGPPETYFVDAAGIVRDRVVGPLTTQSMGTGLAAIGVEGW